jgi:hypothetical protein
MKRLFLAVTGLVLAGTVWGQENADEMGQGEVNLYGYTNFFT